MIISCIKLEFKAVTVLLYVLALLFLLPLQYEYLVYSHMIAGCIILGIICSNTDKSSSYLTLIFVLHCFSAVWNFQSSLVLLDSSINYLKKQLPHNQQEFIQTEKMNL